ncbi:MAG TPA: hypothetical protein VKQ73_06500 [Stellaceae bacterium]|nr:hypothetical protein [Stellaceae bacterium]
MDTILRRSADLPVDATPSRQTSAPKRLLRSLSAVAQRALDRLTLPYRDMPAETFRFPPF